MKYFEERDKEVLRFAQSIGFEIYEKMNRFLPNDPNCGWWGWYGRNWKPYMICFLYNTCLQRTIIILLRSNLYSPILIFHSVLFFLFNYVLLLVFSIQWGISIFLSCPSLITVSLVLWAYLHWLLWSLCQWHLTAEFSRKQVLLSAICPVCTAKPSFFAQLILFCWKTLTF